MRRLTRSFAVFTLIVTAPGMVSAAFAHGGSYRGPKGEIPPDSREPSDAPPPPEGGAPSTPGGEPGGGPTTGGPDAGGPATPGGGGGKGPSTGAGGGGKPSSGGGGGGGPSTGNTRAPGRAPGLGGWPFWWGNNKDEILGVKSAVRRMQQPVVSFGAGRHAPIQPVTRKAMLEEVLPALHTLLADDAESFHIRSAAELAIAKIGDDSIVGTLQKMASGEVTSIHREIQETAALALGLMQRDDQWTRTLLIDIVRRQSMDKTYVRPFSAISLGLIGGKNDREHAAMTAMIEVVAQKEAHNDIKPSCLMAIGLLGDETAVPELVSMVKNGRATLPGAVELNATEVACAVSALGKIGRPGVGHAGDETLAIDEIMRICEKGKAPADVRRSAAIALGQIGPQCTGKLQRRIHDVLEKLMAEAPDEQERSFAVISMGRLAAGKGVDAATRKTAVGTLVREMEKGRATSQPFAGLALGLVGRALLEEGGAVPEEEIRAPLRRKFADGGDPHSRGAYAVASGLVRDPLAAETLLVTLKDTRADNRVRGYSALALGMIGDRSAAETLRIALKDTDRDLRVLASMAAGLLGDADSITDLVTVIRDPDSSNYELGSAALALGQIGDERAVAALLDIAVDAKKHYTVLTRALSVVALGQIGDQRDVPLLARVATDVNYRISCPAIGELLTIL